MNVGYSPTNTEGAELLFQAIIDDCEKYSLIITTMARSPAGEPCAAATYQRRRNRRSASTANFPQNAQWHRFRKEAVPFAWRR